MSKKGIIAALVVCLLPGITFAQFEKKGLEALAKFNAKKLQTVVLRAGLPQAQGRFVAQAFVPAHFTQAQQVGVLGAFVHVQKANAANVSFLHKVEEIHKYSDPDVIAPEIGIWFILGHHGEPPAGKAFYEDQSELAQNLNTYYKGQGVVRRGPDGRDVKLYSLPVDGILYKPVGYKNPVVLSSDSHFVIYNMKTKTGQLIENTPQNLRAFGTQGNSGTFDEVVSYDGEGFEIATGEPEPEPAAKVSTAEPKYIGDFEEVK